MKFNKIKPFALILTAVAVVGAGVAALLPHASNAASEKKEAGPRPALTVSTVKPTRADLPIRLAANGNIAAWQEAIIGSESNGLRLADVLVNVGDQVKKGQVLARFAGETVAADVAQAQAALVEAKATAADAAANAERARTLQDTGALSTQQINQYLTAAETARARVAAARATLVAQQLRQKFVQVTAPDDGIISARNATVGAVVPAAAELFRLIRQGRLEWRAEVTASELGRIKPGLPVTLIAANGSELHGKVRMIGPSVDPRTREALVYVDLRQPAGDTPPARAGMFARGEFNLGESSALTVPQQSLVLREGFTYVFRLMPDNRVQQVKIRTGRRIGDRVEVLEGLPPDAEIVASGAGFLNDGDTVRVAGNGQPAAPSQNTAK
ncbi:MAG: efflux transporter periplasmic adaptor subunit [Noviherbaspirillum sp.]|nr:efflux transporter periplasmic adaptor subunit [Noviherbaspirillum sp.]